jgi:hypothetical protein
MHINFVMLHISFIMLHFIFLLCYILFLLLCTLTLLLCMMSRIHIYILTIIVPKIKNKYSNSYLIPLHFIFVFIRFDFVLDNFAFQEIHAKELRNRG